MHLKQIGVKLIGVLISLLCVNGGGLVYAGKVSRGLLWFLGLLGLALLGLYVLVAGWVQVLWVPLIVFFCWITAYIIMLVDSFRVRGKLRWYQWIGILVSMFFVAQVTKITIIQFIGFYQIPTNAMYPTFQGVMDGKSGDHVLVIKPPLFGKSYQRGDVVAFDTSGVDSIMRLNRMSGITEAQPYMKRIAGLPGEIIQIDPPHLIVNGERVTTPEIFLLQSNQEQGYPGYTGNGQYLTNSEEMVILGDNEYFMLGDNSPNSFDSRSWGVIKGDAIIGKITKRYWPLSRFGKID